MPTILRFRGFNICIYVFDHAPAHVHAKGRGIEVVFLLNCEGGPVEQRSLSPLKPAEEAALARFIEENRSILCKAWEEIHGRDERI